MAAARRRPAAVAPTRRRSARVPRGPLATISGRCRAEDGCPARLVGARRVVSGIAESSQSHDFRVPATSTCGWSGVVAATRHPVQTPARRCRGGLPLVDATAGSRADAWTRCIPAATRHRCAQVDVAGHSERRSPRRFRDTNDRSACADRTCGAPIFRRATTLTRGERLGIHRGRASASRSHCGRASASTSPPRRDYAQNAPRSHFGPPVDAAVSSSAAARPACTASPPSSRSGSAGAPPRPVPTAR